MKQELIKAISLAATQIGIVDYLPQIEYPENLEHGDYSSNIALAYSKKLGKSPRDLAESIVSEIKKQSLDIIDSINIAGPGFINFKIKDQVFANKIIEIASGDGEYGWSSASPEVSQNSKVMVEYTDPNPFKVFHIGHLMSNAVGESISRLIETGGSKVIRACYQGDVGLHVAKTLWAIRDKKINIEDKNSLTIKERVAFLGEMYVVGSQAYEDNPESQKEITLLNKTIFDKSDTEINSLYEKGRKWSLEYFDEIYARLGTSFNEFFFESEVADDGINIVKEFLAKGVFTESEGATIFKGEDHGVHTRVFLTSQGLPTYETKELGLNTEKFRKYPELTESVIITANEQSDYFKVLLKVFSLINPNIFEKTKHISHGILRFASGKMSSRKGNIISAESLIEEIRELVKGKLKDREYSDDLIEDISDAIAIGAIKYTILRQSIGGDVIFDSASSISFEGDSGPYLQYATVRAKSVLEKAKDRKIGNISVDNLNVGTIEKLIVRFPDIIERARNEFAPQHVANYLIALAGAFNAFYASQVILDEKDPASEYRLAITKAFATVMNNGLWVLGIKVPSKM